jgi:hypothetical protein
MGIAPLIILPLESRQTIEITILLYRRSLKGENTFIPALRLHHRLLVSFCLGIPFNHGLRSLERRVAPAGPTLRSQESHASAARPR